MRADSTGRAGRRDDERRRAGRNAPGRMAGGAGPRPRRGRPNRPHRGSPRGRRRSAVPRRGGCRSRRRTGRSCRGRDRVGRGRRCRAAGRRTGADRRAAARARLPEVRRCPGERWGVVLRRRRRYRDAARPGRGGRRAAGRRTDARHPAAGHPGAAPALRVDRSRSGRRSRHRSETRRTRPGDGGGRSRGPAAVHRAGRIDPDRAPAGRATFRRRDRAVAVPHDRAVEPAAGAAGCARSVMPVAVVAATDGRCCRRDRSLGSAPLVGHGRLTHWRYACGSVRILAASAASALP